MKIIKNNPEEEAFEALLKAAVWQYSINELEQYPMKEELDKLVISDTADDKIRRVIKQCQQKEWLCKGLKAMGRIAAVIVIAAGISVAFLPQFKDVRAACYRVWIQITNRYIQYDYEATGEGLEDIEFGYIPEGFYKVREDADIRTYYARYENDKGGAFDLFYSISVSSNLDNEHHIITDIKVNGSDGQYYASTDERFSNMLIWYNDDGCFQIDASLDKDEILKIAENIICRRTME